MVPAYYRSRRGRMFRVQRARVDLPDGRERFVLRAVPIRATTGSRAEPAFETTHERSAEDLLDKLRRGHSLETPERAFESLWQRLRAEIDER